MRLNMLEPPLFAAYGLLVTSRPRTMLGAMRARTAMNPADFRTKIVTAMLLEGPDFRNCVGG
jgi:hypothetical protein